MGVKESTIISMFKRLFLEKEHDKCGTPECCGQCETADSPTTREWGKITLVNKYKEDTPGETPMKRFKKFKEDLDRGGLEENTEEEMGEEKDGLKGSCWKNYIAIGTKKKNGKTVPNCVPKK